MLRFNYAKLSVVNNGVLGLNYEMNESFVSALSVHMFKLIHQAKYFTFFFPLKCIYICLQCKTAVEFFYFYVLLFADLEVVILF